MNSGRLQQEVRCGLDADMDVSFAQTARLLRLNDLRHLLNYLAMD